MSLTWDEFLKLMDSMGIMAANPERLRELYDSLQSAAPDNDPPDNSKPNE